MQARLPRRRPFEAHAREAADTIGRLAWPGADFESRCTVATLVDFHTAHKLLILAHSPDAYRELGRLVGAARALPRGDLARRYAEGLRRALAEPATRGRHTNVLQHMAGYFKDRLDPTSRRQLTQTIADYQAGLVALHVPVTLIRRHAQERSVSYLARQVYLERHSMQSTSAGIASEGTTE